MKQKLMIMLVTALLKALKPDLLRSAVDTLLDKAEDWVTDSETEIDDAIVLPICAMIRDTFGIPDDD